MTGERPPELRRASGTGLFVVLASAMRVMETDKDTNVVMALATLLVV